MLTLKIFKGPQILQLEDTESAPRKAEETGSVGSFSSLREEGGRPSTQRGLGRTRLGCFPWASGSPLSKERPKSS